MSPPPCGPAHRELIHTLHQRYRREWERAERLQHQLDRLRGPRLARAFGWLRSLAGRLRRPAAAPPAGAALGAALTEAAGPAAGRVSVVIPFRDRPELLRGCLRSLRRGAYHDFEVLLVDNGSVRRRTARLLGRVEARGLARVLREPGPFNFARLCNRAAAHAAGDYLLFLNNDTEVLSPDWLERMLLVARRPEVGVVGAVLLYPDGTVQHAGLFPRRDGRWVHAHRGEPGDGEWLRAARAVPAVSGACLMVGRALFEELGGFDERLPLTYNDVDLCCRARQRGRLTALAGAARLLHYECLSRGFAPDEPGAAHLAALPRFPA
jgi:GT2 family glycosyltransferase